VNHKHSQDSDLDVGHVAKLARLNLTEEETRLFQTQLGRILEYAEKLRELDVSGVEDAAHAVPVFNRFREDEPRSGLTADEALANAPRQANGLFIVPKVLQ
jgi:aspartyl-tRNA(Asn)/glutamyl-tRNA(Gln) amidotransferase subunit C